MERQQPATGTTTSQVILALDAEGGDSAPQEMVAGALLAASSRLRILLVGRPEAIEPCFERVPEASRDHVEIVPCSSVISCEQEPVSAVRAMQDSSIVVGARLVSEGRVGGFVSAGSTGAMLAAGLMVAKRVPGIRRPAIVTTLPGLHGPVVFLDAGANADCRAEHLLEFAVLGTAYARAVLGHLSPRVGLLNIGEEEAKGNELTKAAHALLAASGLNFAGNVEGRDLLMNAADVVVTDGFTGNVALKLLEGCCSAVFARVKEAAGAGMRTKTGAMLLRPALRGLRTTLDPEAYGGTYLLGVRGLMVICHGNSSRRAIANALDFAAEALRKGVLEAVGREVDSIIGDAGTPAPS
ncbi:MAG: phosphate acyltransferase PlsX [Thermoleophilia bacterium]